jgi:hypothetical protein
MQSPSCLSHYPLLGILMFEPVFMKFGMYIMTPDPISVMFLINPSHQSSICLFISPVSIKWLSIQFPAAMNV